MSIQFHDDWKVLLKHAWSIRFMALASIFSTAEAMLPLFTDTFPRNILTVLTLISIAGGMWSRLVIQKAINGH